MRKLSDVSPDVRIAFELLLDIEWEQVNRFARRTYLSHRERAVRDTLLEIVAPHFPEIAEEYGQMNNLMDAEASRRLRDKHCA